MNCDNTTVVVAHRIEVSYIETWSSISIKVRTTFANGVVPGGWQKKASTNLTWKDSGRTTSAPPWDVR